MPYNTEQQLADYADARGVVINLSLTQLLNRAHDYIETRNFKGTKADPNQVNQWPRLGVLVNGVVLHSDIVPQDILTAELQTAFAINAGLDPLEVQEEGVKREKVDVLETEYQEVSSSNPRFKMPGVDALLRPYIRSATMGYDR